MPERLDRVTIKLSSRDVTITWKERQELLEELLAEHRDRPLGDRSVNRAICKAFEDVGAGAVILTREQKGHLAGRLEWWGAYTKLSPGLLELRDTFRHALRNGKFG